MVYTGIEMQSMRNFWVQQAILHPLIGRMALIPLDTSTADIIHPISYVEIADNVSPEYRVTVTCGIEDTILQMIDH